VLVVPSDDVDNFPAGVLTIPNNFLAQNPQHTPVPQQSLHPAIVRSIHHRNAVTEHSYTCFCNDLYREAAKRGPDVQEIKVEVTGVFRNPVIQHATSTIVCKCGRMLQKLSSMILFEQRIQS